MRTRTVTERIGEDMGPIDWSHPMVAELAKQVPTLVERLREAEADPTAFVMERGWSWRDVLAVRMYDGWPYWEPTPSVLRMGPLGAEWHSFLAVLGGGFDRRDCIEELRERAMEAM